jgi:hypothetical protein
MMNYTTSRYGVLSQEDLFILLESDIASASKKLGVKLGVEPHEEKTVHAAILSGLINEDKLALLIKDELYLFLFVVRNIILEYGSSSELSDIRNKAISLFDTAQVYEAQDNEHGFYKIRALHVSRSHTFCLPSRTSHLPCSTLKHVISDISDIDTNLLRCSDFKKARHVPNTRRSPNKRGRQKR